MKCSWKYLVVVIVMGCGGIYWTYTRSKLDLELKQHGHAKNGTYTSHNETWDYHIEVYKHALPCKCNHTDV